MKRRRKKRGRTGRWKRCVLVEIWTVNGFHLCNIAFDIYCIFILQEPLNSGDDVSDEEDQELFDTENVVVCQYDKVVLTYTIMSIKGRSTKKWNKIRLLLTPTFNHFLSLADSQK